jgi:ABC-type transport system involved in cytochrome bd biosynthesis fused ATPase/permease subunit
VRHGRVVSPADENDPIFEVDHLVLNYPDGRGHPAVEILHDVSFSVERGHAVTLVGPSGSGKSSVLRCLNRLVEPTSGTVRFDGRDIRSFDSRELRRRAALVMQTPVMFEGTVRDNLCIRPIDVPGDFSESRLATPMKSGRGKLLGRGRALSGGENARDDRPRLLSDPLRSSRQACARSTPALSWLNYLTTSRGAYS